MMAIDDSVCENIDKLALELYPLLCETKDMKERRDYACRLADVIGSSGSFEKYINGDAGELTQDHQKLLDNFKNNVGLLVAKTWVDRKDEKHKAQALVELESFVGMIRANDYQNAISVFVKVAGSVASLLFGDEADNPDFLDYVSRIDPTLGSFYWFVSQLSNQETVVPDLAFVELLLGITALASF